MKNKNREYKIVGNPHYIFKVPNTAEGKFLIDRFRHTINPRYKIRIRGSTASKKLLRNKYPHKTKQEIEREARYCGSSGNVPLDCAKWLRVYIYEGNRSVGEENTYDEYERLYKKNQEKIYNINKILNGGY